MNYGTSEYFRLNFMKLSMPTYRHTVFVQVVEVLMHFMPTSKLDFSEVDTKAQGQQR